MVIEMRIVVTLGGNALLRRGEALTAENQMRNIRLACSSLKNLAASHELVLGHGNGPQVGLLALQNEAFSETAAPYPLDVLGAESQAMIGCMFAQAMHSVLPEQNGVYAALLTLADGRALPCVLNKGRHPTLPEGAADIPASPEESTG